MLNSKGIEHKAEFPNNLNNIEKLVFILNKLNLKFTYDKDKVTFLSSGVLSKRTTNKKPN